MGQEYPSAESLLAAEAAAPQEPAPVEQAAPPPEPTAPPAPPPEKTWDLNWNGRQIRANEQDLLKWASQGYDYSQRMSEFNQQKADLETKFRPFQEMDDFARRNPDWWAHVDSGWKNREQIQQQQMLSQLPEQFKPVFENLLNEQRELKQFQAQWHQEKLEQAAKQADTSLQEAVGNIQKRHGIDFQSRDQSGQTLEFQVLKFARDNRIDTGDPAKDFEIAFNAYYQPHFANLYEMRGREAERKELAKARQQGLLGTAPAPSQQAPLRPARNYEEAYQASLKDLGLNPN
jgi:hypothetical protein